MPESKFKPSSTDTRTRFARPSGGHRPSAMHSTSSTPMPKRPHVRDDRTSTPLTSSRIIVKNIPKYADEKRLREHFGAMGEVTDVRMVKTDEGQSRRFTFIGFKSDKQAQMAVKQFDQTFMDTCKMSVELARPFGDPNLPRPWSRHTRRIQPDDVNSLNTTKDTPTATKKTPTSKLHHLIALYEKTFHKKVDPALLTSPAFSNFLATMHATSSSTNHTPWSNDDNTSHDKNQKKIENSSLSSKKSTTPKGTHTLFDGVEGKQEKKVKKDSKETSHPNESDDDDESDYQDLSKPTVSVPPSNSHTHPSSAPSSELLSLQTFLKSKVSLANPTQRDASASLILDTGRLFVRNLPFTATADELTALFSRFGPLIDVHLPVDASTRQPKGFAYVLFMMPQDAVRALTELDGAILQGRLLHVLPAHSKEKEKEKEKNSISNNGISGQQGEIFSSSSTTSTFKSKRIAQQRDQYQSDGNTNSLYMSADAVADAHGEKHALLLEHPSLHGSVALALAETQAIQQTTAYFAQEGILLDALQATTKQGVKRSDTMLLVKNIPHKTQLVELQRLFATHGMLRRCLLPPSKTMAIVEYVDASAAKLAFQYLSFSNFHGKPLYLEYAPLNLIKDKEEKGKESKDNESKDKENISKSKIESVSTSVSTSVSKSVPENVMDSNNTLSNDLFNDISSSNDETVLYVKNVAFATTDEVFKATFERIVPDLRSAQIARKKRTASSHPSNPLSLGFGFVECRTREDALRVLRTLQGVSIDGHTWQLQFAKRDRAQSVSNHSNNKESTNENATGCKLILRNVPFEATRKELQQLLRPLGQLLTLRLPQKTGVQAQHRGFAFATFASHAEAMRVKTALAATHFYGRHLVVDWADQEEKDKALDQLRAKTRQDYTGLQHQTLSRKRAKTEEEEEEKEESDEESSLLY